MPTLDELVDDFLAQERIAVAGLSRSGNQPGNLIYRKLKEAGHQVFAVNPKAEDIDGDPCYPSLKAIPEPVDGVVITTHPDVTEQLVRDCIEVGVPRVWIHRSFGQGSVSEKAVADCRVHGITVIAGGCPMMFCQPVDFGHKCIRWVLNLTGGLPKGER